MIQKKSKEDSFFSCLTDCKNGTFFPLKCLMWHEVGTAVKCQYLDVIIDPKSKKAEFRCLKKKIKCYGPKRHYKGKK